MSGRHVGEMSATFLAKGLARDQSVEHLEINDVHYTIWNPMEPRIQVRLARPDAVMSADYAKKGMSPQHDMVKTRR